MNIIREDKIQIVSLMTYMGFERPEELDAVEQAINIHRCDVQTVRWAVNWMENNWGGVPDETLEYLGLKLRVKE